MTGDDIRELAREAGFELAGVAAAHPVPERAWYREWIDRGFAGEMHYLEGRRAELRNDPANLLPSVKSIVCVGRLYNTPWPYSTRFRPEDCAWISRYAWGDDYHEEVRASLERLDTLVRARAGQPIESRICVDTAPLLERSYARLAGLGWIGKNTCLINQQSGSWFFLGELLLSLEIEPDSPPPDRCGTCTRCIDACPTEAIIAGPMGHTVDSRLCISYFTIELRGPIPEQSRSGVGAHVFGCDICQDVCPWNRRAPVTPHPAYAPRRVAPPLEELARLSEEEFRTMFRGSPVTRAKYSGFIRNVAVAMGSLGRPEFRAPLEKLAGSPDESVRQHAVFALRQLDRQFEY